MCLFSSNSPQQSTIIADEDLSLENLCRLSIARSVVDSSYQDSLWNVMSTEYISRSVKEEMRREIGLGNYFLLADEVQRYIPEAVRVNVNGEKGVSYSDITALLVGALKSMKRIIDAQNEDLLTLKEKYSETENKAALSGRNFNHSQQTDVEKVTSFLSQNIPNPFSKNTTINYTISEDSNTASILIFDMQGTLLKTYKNLTKGDGDLVISGNELQAGMYFYTLVVDDEEIDTKKMILTK